jgi:cobalt-zinc-cadmium efflux system membrane fusion protein
MNMDTLLSRNMNTLLSLLMATLTAGPLCAEDDGHGHEGHGHEGHAHGEPKAYAAEELFTVSCEHDILHYTCDECRYELGLVKLDASVVRSETNPAGLLVIEPATKRSAQTLLPLNGELAVNETALTHVSPRVAGTVRAIRAELGQRVEKDEILFEIESAELGRAIGDYRKNKALAALALRNLERENALVAQKLSPEVDRVEAQMKYDEFRIELEAAENALAVMGLDSAAIAALTADAQVGKIGTLPIRASQAGTVIKKHVTLGEAVEAGEDLMVLADLSTVWAWMSLYERDLARLLGEAKTRPPRVRITTLAFPELVCEGVIDLIGATVDAGDRTIKVRAELRNPDALLRPGMFCQADVVFETQENVVAVPTAALLSDEGKHFVFRLIREGFALRTDVEVGRTFADSVEITQGLTEGEQIVTEGAFVCKSDVLRAKMGAGCAD